MSAANKSQPRPTAQPQAVQSTHPTLLRTLQGVAIGTAAIAVIAMIAYLILGVQWYGQTFAGFNTAYTLVVDGNQSLTADEWAGIEAGIRRLDRITAVNDTAFPAQDYAAGRAQLRDEINQLDYGDTASITFLRPTTNGAVSETGAVTCGDVQDGFAECSVSYTLQPIPDGDFLTFFVFPYATSLIALIIGLVLLVIRFRQPSALLISIFCVSLAVFSAGIFNNSTTYFPIPIWIAVTILGSGAGLMLALMFPTQFASIHRFPVLLAAPVVVTVGFISYGVYQYYGIASPYDFTAVWQTPVLFALASYALLALSLIFRRHFAVSSIHRDQVNTSLIGIGLAAIPSALWIISTINILVETGITIPFNSATVVPFFITVPIGFAYAVLQYRGFDSERVLSQGITYTIMLASLIIGYALLVFGVNLIALEFIPENIASSPLVVGTVIFVIAMLFLPFREQLQRQIDRIYYRAKRQHQDEIEAFTNKVANTQDFQEILRLYVDRVIDVTDARSLFVFLPDEETGDYIAHHTSQPQTDVQFDADSDMLALLRRIQEPFLIRRETTWEPELVSEKTGLNILKAHLLVALRGGGENINGFVIVGPPSTQRLYSYSYENIRFIENLSAQMAISVERAKIVESLERRVNELDVLSQVSQAVNFAVEFDDLLELISSQTQRLVEAIHFYIALRDANTNQMYYAFFLEFNERLRDRENRRWNMGGDLFAQILEEGKPRRYNDFNVTVQMLNVDRRDVDSDVKAWMGVPLIAGQTRLGVMAVGSSQQTFTYSDEQLKIFSDIGALAATSLDKARLFEETNQRARQLRALNEISRQLQSERDVDKLSTMITSSAVDILESEAGSLLLTAEDEDNENRKLKDLVFRVVIGGSGEELVGKSVKAGHGLVGEVARSAAPVIVNNTQSDERWEGELTNDEGFNTDAILAVPLIANNEVIGVLEVLNKVDGSLFVKEDADVLETFAGQAAIAIENARLFQKTDEQLSLRVQELETLERIDTELNRALDTQRVAEITVKWAVANTGANAALIGLVRTGETPKLQLLARYGYEDGEMPAGTEDDLLPLDVGIAGRVLQTKRADTQNDITIDPAYVPSLRGGNSQITVPMLAGGEVIAILILEKNTEPRLNILDQAFVQRLTDHAAIALENARLYGELASANKTQSRFMGVGAHELKNALSPIRGWTDLLHSGVLGDINDQQANYLGVIKSNADRMQLIIDDLKDFAKMRANELRVEPEPSDFRKVVVETLRTFTAQLEEKNQTLVNNVEENLPLIMGDSQRLIQVMTNFVSNANKYSPNEATITLDAQVERDRKNDKGGRLGDFLHITIADTGIGMSEEDQRKMFTPYFRSENQEAHEQPGTGLGMSLTRELIIQHRGEVWLESELGEGTTFHFTIPLATEEEVETTTEPASD